MRRLFLATFFAIALLTKTDPGSAHEYSRYGTVESLVHRGTFALDDSSFIGTVDKIHRNGHYYSHQPPLLPVLEAPVYWALQLPGIRFNNRGRFVMTYLFILFTNGLALALTVVVLAKILELAGVPPNRRDLFAVLLVCGTWLLPYGIVSNNHGISGLLLAAFIYVLLRVEWQGMSSVRAMCIGGLLGLLTAIELLPLVSFVPVTLCYLWARRDMTARRWLTASIALAVPIAIAAALNIPITGDIIPAGFHHELFNYPGSVFDEASLTGNVKYQSVGEVADYAWTSLFAGKGFFTFAPLRLLGLLAGLVAWSWWARARGVHLVLLGGIVLSLGAALVTTNNHGGEAVGFRHAVYLAPAFTVLLLPWVVGGVTNVRPQSSGVAAVGTISLVLMLLVASRQPWSVLTLPSASIGTWEEYVPIIAKIVHGNLFRPG